MSILTMCSNPACGELFEVPEVAIRKGVAHCPSCGGQMKVAAPNPAGKGAAAPAVPASHAAPAGAAAPPAGDPRLLELDLDDGAAQPRAAGASAHSPGRESAVAAASKPSASPPASPSQRLAENSPAAPTQSAKPRSASPSAADAGELDVDIILTPKETSPVRHAAQPPAAPVEQSPSSARRGAKPADAPGPAKNDPLAKYWTDDPGESDENAGIDAIALADAQPAQRKPVAATVFALGFIGMAAGLLCGVWLFPSQRLFAAYVGAGLGWVAGFTFAAMIILGLEQAEGQQRCSACHAAWPASGDSCPQCGGQAAESIIDPLTADCLRAGSYYLTKPSGIVGPVSLTIVGCAMVLAADEARAAIPSQSILLTPLVYVLGAAAGYLILAQWFAYVLKVITQTVEISPHKDKVPAAPSLAADGTLAAGGKALALLGVYVLPLVTIPLLPLAALLFARSAGKSHGGEPAHDQLQGQQPLNPMIPARAAWRNAKAFAVLWLLLLLWLAGMALAWVIVWLACSLAPVLPPMDGPSQSILRVTLSSLAVAAFAVVLGTFTVIMARCVGAIGRHRRDLFSPAA
jgi:hypothetical protein